MGNAASFFAGLALLALSPAPIEHRSVSLEMANTLGMFKEQTALQRDLASLDTQTKVNLANLNAQLTTAGLNVQERLGIMDAELKKYGINLQGDQALLQTILKNDFDYAQLKVQGDVANLDANVKLQLK